MESFGSPSPSQPGLGSTSLADAWANGDTYELYIGRWSRLVAREFLDWLAVAQSARWLDVGCGTGALTQTILAMVNPARVDAVDSSADYVSFARDQVRDPRANFEVANAQHLPLQAESVDVAVSGLVLNFIPQPLAAVAEMARVVCSGGVAAAYVWDYADGMQLIRHFWDAAIALDAQASELDEARRFPICQSAALESLFRSAGLRDIESRAIEVPTRFHDFDDYWRPFLGGQGPAPGYAMRLGEEHRTALRDRIRAQLPIERNGSINLIARAWAVRGRRI
jgi:SAM-dependent methyltransferase